MANAIKRKFPLTETYCQEINEHQLLYQSKGWPYMILYGIDGHLNCTCKHSDCSAPGKHPINSGWKNTPIKKKIDKVSQGFVQNIALLTGKDMFVVDIDCNKGGDDSIDDLKKIYGPLPDTVTAYTGFGSHLYFKTNGLQIPNKVDLCPGVDIRGKNGYVVCPPSRHYSGKQYYWDVDFHPEFFPLADPPKWLLNLMLNDSKTSRVKKDWASILSSEVAEGNRNVTLAQYAGFLFRKQLEKNEIIAILNSLSIAYFKPPISIEEIKLVVTSIEKKILRAQHQQFISSKPFFKG